jgi:virulence-associated protein VagC
VKQKTASIFRTGASQAVRLPEELRFEGDSVLARPEGDAEILEPTQGWPEGYVQSFAGIPEDFERPPQGEVEKRRKIG